MRSSPRPPSGPPTAAGQPARLAHLGRALQGDRAPAPQGQVRRRAGRARAPARTGEPGAERARRRAHRRRPSAPDLHVLPSGAAAGRPHRDDIARDVRPDDRGGGARVPDVARDGRAADRPREGQDPRSQHPLRGAGGGGASAPAGWRAASRLPRVHRRLRGIVRRLAHPARPVQRGDPPRPVARRSAAGSRDGRAARPHAPARGAAGGARVRVG